MLYSTNLKVQQLNADPHKSFEFKELLLTLTDNSQYYTYYYCLPSSYFCEEWSYACRLFFMNFPCYWNA